MTSKIFKLALAAATLASSSVSAFAKAEETSFQRDGFTYVYSVTERGKARQIRGKYYPGGRTFALEVRDDRVRGTINGFDVSFPVSAARSAHVLASAE